MSEPDGQLTSRSRNRVREFRSHGSVGAWGGKPPLSARRKEKLDCGYRIDLLVENALIVELKSVESLLPVHHAQLITYLKLSGIKVGLLINFNQSKLKDGIKRIVV